MYVTLHGKLCKIMSSNRRLCSSLASQSSSELSLSEDVSCDSRGDENK
jgi:hypothetical protein